METKIGSRLITYRKAFGYSQEELSFKLGVSRQAVSKWECDETLPDTENLIALSKIYNVSLDKLLNEDPLVEVKKEENKKVVGENLESIETNKEDKVIEKVEKRSTLERRMAIISGIICSTLLLLVTVIYLVLGFTLKDSNGWKIYWTLYFLPFVISSIHDALSFKKVSKFNITFLVLFIYLLLGMLLGKWHPTWLVFLAIPIFYGIVEPIERLKK